MCIGVGGHNAFEICACRRHHKRVAVECTDHVHLSGEHWRPHLISCADRTGWKSGAECLGETDHVGLDPEELRCATGGNGESSLHFIHNPNHAVLLRDAAHFGEVARLRENHAAVHQRRLHDQTGGELPLGLHSLKSAFECGCIIEWNRNGHLCDDVWDPLAVWD